MDEERQSYLELLNGKLLLVTNTDTPAAQVVAHYKSLADIERGFRVLKSDIEIGPVYHRLPQRIRAHAMVCFVALVLYRVMRMRLTASRREESPPTLGATQKDSASNSPSPGRSKDQRTDGDQRRTKVAAVRTEASRANPRSHSEPAFVVCALKREFN